MNIFENYTEEELNLEFMECLVEMSSVRPIGTDNSILLAINPDSNRDGEPYFKMYDSDSWSTATKVWRISFHKPELIKSHKGKIPAATAIVNKEKKLLLEYLKKPSRENRKVTIWDELKYKWNLEKDFMNQFGFENYLNGDADKFYKSRDTKGNYLPNSLEMPDYTLL